MYKNEKEGQINFYEKLREFDGTIPQIEDNTDGVIRGTILEFKKSITDYNITLFQTIKYLSRMRNLGKKIPFQILLISLNDKKAYLFKSENFFEEIETQYIGSASKNNSKFYTDTKPREINYTNNYKEIINILECNDFLRVHVDKYNIVGLATAYYEITKNSIEKKFRKLEFAEELVNPEFLYIYPYAENKNKVYEKSKLEFPGLVDLLNDKLLQKELGAFYTPDEYVKKATELLREAIIEVPKGNDYIILDRCAGTGQLENFLTEEELSHCILSTYETWEWNVLYNKFIDKVRLVIPPTASAENSLVEGGDALSRHFILGEQTNVEPLQEEYKTCIEQLNNYVKNEKCNIIIFENPPYQDATSINFSEDKSKKIKVKSDRKDKFVTLEMKKDLHNLNEMRASAREISNLFIWSAFKYYLKKDFDNYILFSPVKYFKSIGLVNKTFKKGFLCNRKYFHASPSSISCIWWQNIDKKQNEFVLPAFDITGDRIEFIKDVKIEKVFETFKLFNDKRQFADDITNNVVCKTDGFPDILKKGKAIYNQNIIAYLRATSFNLDANSRCLVRINLKDGLEQNYGFHLRSDNYLEKLPLFCAKLYPQENWYEKDVYFTTADGGNKYIQDNNFLKSCFIFTCLSQYNKCITFDGIDGRHYQNELCFDIETIASKDLEKFELNNEDKKILNLRNKVLKEAEKTEEYNKNFKYGTYQINKELNTFYEDERGNKIFNYISLNTEINGLKNELKNYYKTQIQEKLFKYELLK